MIEEIQLFATTGNLVDTVLIPWHAEIVLWKHKYYALREGRYVECKCVSGYVPAKQPASLVSFDVRMQ